MINLSSKFSMKKALNRAFFIFKYSIPGNKIFLQIFFVFFSKTPL